MNPWRRLPPSLHRLLTASVGVLFMVAFLSPQFAYCQCCILFAAAMEEHGEEEREPAHECCMVAGQDDAIKAGPAPIPHGHDDADGCKCPMEFSQNEEDAPLAAFSARIGLKDPASATPPAHGETAVAEALVVAEDFAAWRPTRGSPPPPAPLHVLNSIFII